ncbi:hypothetical protein M758_4G210500 [Ceratodon purpureus]|nr:hypothetical protein M758_4G210500 [Ceratodon purpureus]
MMVSSEASPTLTFACLVIFILAAFCVASRPIDLPLHEPAIAETPVLNDTSPLTSISTAADITPKPALQSVRYIDTAKDELAANVKTQAWVEGDCRLSDIEIKQGMVSTVGLPIFKVQVSNLCTNPRCSISSVIVHCGLFHTGGMLVNPKVFRRLDASKGTCIVNDGQQIPNADTISFEYKEIWVQKITFLSGRLNCQR